MTKLSRKTVDPRIYFAMTTCSFTSPCVAILQEDTVQEQLQRLTEDYLNTYVTISSDKQTITVPKQFQWFAPDFGSSSKEVVEWVVNNLPASSLLKKSVNSILISEKVEDIKIAYLTFSWDFSLRIDDKS